ncbi:MAG: MFS transporter, partial [Lysobacteraceae bacterium]
VTVLRWIAVAFLASDLPAMLVAQATHALGFALFHACLMQRMAGLFESHEAGAGQGLLYGFSSGLGGVAGALIAAGLWEWRGGTAAFLGAALITASALLLHVARPAPSAAG